VMDSWFSMLSYSRINFCICGFCCLTVLFASVTYLKRFTRYGHYVGEVEDIITGRLAIIVSSGGARIFFLGGLGPFPPSFPFSSLPPFPLLSLPPSPPPPFPAPHRPVARIVKTRRQIGRVPLPSRTLPFPALTSPSLPSLYSPPSLPSPSLPSPSLPSRPFPSPPLRSRPP